MKTAVIYASKFGNTKKTAEYIANKIGADAINVKNAENIEQYERIILGCGIYAGKPSKLMTDFTLKNRKKFKNVSLFVTCLFNGDKGTRQIEKISELYGIKDAIFFDRVKKQIGIDGSKLEEYIKTL
ncbi:MAG: flavodoxin domain-containing protein [archaeon]|nr:flavodoxin domain-containing protein [archaeon]